MDMSLIFAVFVTLLTSGSCFVTRNVTFMMEMDAKLSALLKPGESLEEHSVEDLQEDGYRVTVSGGLENYCKWPLMMRLREVKSGKVTVPLGNIYPGFVEGFASRKTSWTATGSWVRYTVQLDDDIFTHLMYSAPFNFDFYTNKLAVGMCGVKDTKCQHVDAKTLLYNYYEFIDLKEFKSDERPAQKCYDDVCVSATMETSHKASIRMRIYPKSYNDLSYSMRYDTPNNREDYETFVKMLFKL